MSEPPIVYPNQVQLRLNDLATCLCAQIIADGLPEVCWCGQVPGEIVSFDYAGDCNDACGMAWVRLIQVYPSTVVGEPSAQPGNCSTLLGFDVEIGIVRCAPVIQEGGEFPSVTEQADAVALQIADMMAMRRAIVCCSGHKDFLLGPYTPVGPDGGVVGGAWTVAMQE